MKKRILSLLLIVILLSSSLAMAEGKAGIKDVLFPNYINDFVPIREDNIGDDHYEMFDLIPNGSEIDGSAVTEWHGNTAASWDVYKIPLVEEGLVSIIAEPKAYDDTYGTLRMTLYFTDYRSGKSITARDAWNVLKHTKSDGWEVVDRYSFYGYPGTYYLVVTGVSSEKNGKYNPIDYKIKAIQDAKVARTSGFNPDISYQRKNGGTQYFGTVLLDGTISISDSLNLSNWSYKAENSDYATEKTIKDALYNSGVRKNVFDCVNIETKVDGVVQMSVISDAEKVVGEQNCRAMDICSETWLERLMSTTSADAKTKYAERIAENRFVNIAVGNGGGYFRDVQSGEVVSFEAKADTVYSIDVSSYSARPLYYTLKVAGPGYNVDDVTSQAVATAPEQTTTPAQTTTAPQPAATNAAADGAEAFDNGNLISWQPVSGALGYRPFRSENPNELGISVTDFYLEQTEHVDVNVEPNVTYYYCVKPVLAEADPLNDKDEVLGATIATYTVKTSPNIVDAGKSKQYIKLKIDDPKMDVNGVISEVDPGRGTTPLIVRGRTVVPIRAIVEAMGGTIAWDGTARKVTINARGNSVEMWLDKKEIAVNGVKQAIDVAPESINGRTMVPIRFATENLDCKVSWINSTRQVIIVYTGK